MNKEIVFKPVKSSQLLAIGHKEDVLYIKFKSKDKKTLKHHIWSYAPVNVEKYEEFKNSDSIGKYFHDNFKMNSDLSIKPLK